MSYKSGSAALAFAAALCAASCGGGGGSTSSGSPTAPTTTGGGTSATTVTIVITGQNGKLAFNPNPASVDKGQLVVFKNNDVVTHHIMLDDGSIQTSDIAPGATSAAVSMGTSGSSTYHCSIHPGMVGGFNGAQAEPPPNCSQQYCFGGG